MNSLNYCVRLIFAILGKGCIILLHGEVSCMSLARAT